jgi:hypothetical protein
MAAAERREVRSYLRDGSLWVGHFIVSDGELNFGDDRFDAAHGLANVVLAERTNSATEPFPQAWVWLAGLTGEGKPASVPKLDALTKLLRLAA